MKNSGYLFVWYHNNLDHYKIWIYLFKFTIKNFANQIILYQVLVLLDFSVALYYVHFPIKLCLKLTSYVYEKIFFFLYVFYCRLIYKFHKIYLFECLSVTNIFFF